MRNASHGARRNLCCENMSRHDASEIKVLGENEVAGRIGSQHRRRWERSRAERRTVAGLDVNRQRNATASWQGWILYETFQPGDVVFGQSVDPEAGTWPRMKLTAALTRRVPSQGRVRNCRPIWRRRLCRQSPISP